MQRVELERYRRSFFGKYANKYLANLPQSLRIVGFVVMAIGAWYHGAVDRPLWFARDPFVLLARDDNPGERGLKSPITHLKNNRGAAPCG